MSTILEPLFAECAMCPGWQVPAYSDEEKQRRENKHNEVRHGGMVTSEAVADLLYADPKNTRARDVVEECIREDAETHGGEVNSNRVRDTIPAWVNPRLTSSVYSVLLRRGTLVPHAELRSTDRKGRNAGRKLNTYLYRGLS